MNDDTAIVVSEGGIVFSGETTCPSDRLVRATWVLAKRDGHWFVAAYHNCPLKSKCPSRATSLEADESDRYG